MERQGATRGDDTDLPLSLAALADSLTTPRQEGNGTSVCASGGKNLSIHEPREVVPDLVWVLTSDYAHTLSDCLHIILPGEPSSSPHQAISSFLLWERVFRLCFLKPSAPKTARLSGHAKWRRIFSPSVSLIPANPFRHRLLSHVFLSGSCILPPDYPIPCTMSAHNEEREFAAG